MADGANAVLVAVLIAIVAVSVPRSIESAVTCKSVVSSLTPCATYLVEGGEVPKNCCKGVKALYKEANTTTDRQTACRCIEQTATIVPGISIENASSLPGKCKVHIPYKITRTFNCSTYYSYTYYPYVLRFTLLQITKFRANKNGIFAHLKYCEYLKVVCILVRNKLKLNLRNPKG